MDLSSVEATEVLTERQVANDVYREAVDPSCHVDDAIILTSMISQTGEKLLGVF